MSTVTPSGLTNVTAGNLTDAARIPLDDANSDTKYATPAQLRVQLNTNAQQYAAGTVGGANTKNWLHKATASIANAVGTAVLTVTVPNAAHSASVTVKLTGSLGAGGTIGANEATGSVWYNIAIARTAGVAAAPTISTAYGSAMANVAGADTITVTAALSAVSGAVGAVNTFTVNVTISRGGGSSDNHTCVVEAEVHNANASGITLS